MAIGIRLKIDTSALQQKCFKLQYNDSEQDTDGHNTIKTNLNVSALLLS